jgi:hypothetical protein
MENAFNYKHAAPLGAQGRTRIPFNMSLTITKIAKA